MKNFLIALAIFATVGVVGFIVVQHRMEYLKGLQVSTAAARSRDEAKRAEQIKVITTENDNLKKDNAFLRSNCLKGATAYAKLPPATQKLIGGIDCGE